MRTPSGLSPRLLPRLAFEWARSLSICVVNDAFGRGATGAISVGGANAEFGVAHVDARKKARGNSRTDNVKVEALTRWCAQR